MFIWLGTPNSDEAPNALEQTPTAQSLLRDAQVAIINSGFFDCCKDSDEIVTAGNSDLVQAILLHMAAEKGYFEVYDINDTKCTQKL